MIEHGLIPISARDLNRRQVEEGLQRLSAAHHLCGVAVAGTPALLVVRSSDPTGNWTDVHRFLNYGCFGASANLVTVFENDTATLVCVPRGTREFAALNHAAVHIAIVHGSRILSAHKLIGWQFDNICRAADDYEVVLPHDKAHQWEVLATCDAQRETYPLRLSRRDQLCSGWVMRYREQVADLWSWLRSLSQSQLPEVNDVAPAAREVLQAVRERPCDLNVQLEYFQREIGDDYSRLCQLFRAWPTCIDLPGMSVDERIDASERWQNLPLQLWDLYLQSPSVADFGCQIPWVDHSSNTLKRLRVDVAQFPADCDPRQYWASVPRGNRVAIGSLVAGNDLFVSDETLIEGWQGFAGAEQAAEALQCAERLLDEAVVDKRGTIPSHALVDIRIGPFTHVEFVESEGVVFAGLRTERGEIHVVDIIPKCHYCSFHLPATVPITKAAEIEAGVVLLLAAIVRDFWVVEDREAVFRGGTIDVRGAHRTSNAGMPRIVYLPRIRYLASPDTLRCTAELRLSERHPHLVSPHRRRLGLGRSASDHQRMLAALYGFDLAEGYTFVGPHARGQLARDVIYRSRSALQSLYTAENGSRSAAPVQWFRFERDVQGLMESLGFAVQHVAAARHGDHGIDVFATKGSDFELVNWVIQCKCWHPKRKVSAAVVRELVGTLSRYPRGTRGMVVATCGFATGAIDEANSADIRLVDGAEFARLCTAVKPTHARADSDVLSEVDERRDAATR